MYRILSTGFSLKILPLVFIVLLTFLLTSPLWQQAGIPNTADAHHHLPRSAAVKLAFEQDVYWPRWFPSSNDGRGEPTFHYYSPGLYWLVGAVHWAGIGLDQALTLVVTAAFVLSGLGVYGWLRHTFSRKASLASTAIYVGMPHIYSRTFLITGDYPQLLAILTFPVILWAFTALYFRFRVRFWLLAIFSLAGLVFSHQQQALIGAGTMLIYCLLLATGYRKWDGLARCMAAVLLAAFISAGYWMPALGDLPLVQVQGELREREFQGTDFLSWKTLLSVQPFVWDFRAGNPLTGPHNTFGVAQWLSAVTGLAGTLFWRRDRRQLIWCIAGIIYTLAVLSLTTPLAVTLWESFSGLSILQFPFRLLPAAVLGVLPAAAALVDVLPRRLRLFSSATVLVIAIVFPFPYLFPALASHTSIVQIDDQTADAFSGRNPGVWHFLPRGIEKSTIWEYKPEKEPVKLSYRSPHEAVADISGQSEPVLLWMHFHPGWRAGSGAVLTSNSAGWGEVTDVRSRELPLILRWEGTVWQFRGECLSLLGLLVCIAGILYYARRRRRDQTQGITIHEEHEQKFPIARSLVDQWALVGLMLFLVAARYSMSWFNTLPFLYHSPPDRLAFAVEGQPTTVGDATNNSVTLLGWKLISGTKPSPGDIVVVRLYWQPQGQISEELSSNVHLYTPALQRSWAVENRGVYRPPANVWSPEKYYIETMHLMIPVDVPPITYSLVAGLVSSTGKRLAVPGSADGLLPLRTVTVSPLRTGFLQRERPTVVASAGTADSLKLQGYDLFADGGELALRLFWETAGEVATNWILYVHLHDPHSERIAQFDGPPLAGLKGTSEWQPGALYIDRRQISLPPGLSEGDYLFRIGLYDRDSGERLPFLPVVDDQVPFENGQLLVPFTIPFDKFADDAGVTSFGHLQTGLTAYFDLRNHERRHQSLNTTRYDSESQRFESVPSQKESFFASFTSE